jgi:hypothetical protein
MGMTLCVHICAGSRQINAHQALSKPKIVVEATNFEPTHGVTRAFMMRLLKRDVPVEQTLAGATCSQQKQNGTETQ